MKNQCFCGGDFVPISIGKSIDLIDARNELSSDNLVIIIVICNFIIYNLFVYDVTVRK